MALDLSFHPCPDLFLYIQHFFRKCQNPPKPRNSIVRQTFIVHHSAADTAAGAGDTRMDKMKHGPLGSTKPGASSDKFASILEWTWSHRSGEGRSKLHNRIPFRDGDDKLQCAEPSAFAVSFILQQPHEVLIAPIL